MYVGETPWHSLGNWIPEGKMLTIDEAIITSGLDREIKRRRLFAETDHYTRLIS